VAKHLIPASLDESAASPICVTLICTRGYAQCIVQHTFNDAHQISCVISCRAFFFQVPHLPQTRLQQRAAKTDSPHQTTTSVDTYQPWEKPHVTFPNYRCPPERVYLEPPAYLLSYPVSCVPKWVHPFPIAHKRMRLAATSESSSPRRSNRRLSDMGI